MNQYIHPGQIINDKYEIIESIGSGGMAFVLSAHHKELNEKVALKFLNKDFLLDPELVARFSREAQAAVKIKSAYVTQVLDVCTLPDGVPFIVMEHLNGKNLYEIINERGPFETKLAVEYIMQACEALAVAHTVGIVHRDIKPENIFLVYQEKGIESIKILDFGISKMILTGSAFESKIKTKFVMGSPIYMSPEQVRCAEIDERTDIWSLGCVLYELITGKAAFDAPSLMQLSAAILEETPEYNTLIPIKLYDIILKCLEKNSENRYKNIAELAMALLAFAPPRSRISAERCWYLMNEEAISFEPLSLPVKPPSNSTPFDLVKEKPKTKSKIIIGLLIICSILIFSLFYKSYNKQPEEIKSNITILTPTISTPTTDIDLDVIDSGEENKPILEEIKPTPIILQPLQPKQIIKYKKNIKQKETQPSIINPDTDVGF